MKIVFWENIEWYSLPNPRAIFRDELKQKYNIETTILHEELKEATIIFIHQSDEVQFEKATNEYQLDVKRKIKIIYGGNPTLLLALDSFNIRIEYVGIKSLFKRFDAFYSSLLHNNFDEKGIINQVYEIFGELSNNDIVHKSFATKLPLIHEWQRTKENGEDLWQEKNKLGL